MRNFVFVFLIAITGCSMFETDFEVSREKLKQQVELLELERRKIALQLSIYKIESAIDDELTKDQ